MKGIATRIGEQLEKVQEASKAIQAKDEAADTALNDIRTTVEETQEIVKSSFSNWAEELRSYCETTYQQTESTSIATFTTVSMILMVTQSVLTNATIE